MKIEVEAVVGLPNALLPMPHYTPLISTIVVALVLWHPPEARGRTCRPHRAR
jgi:hypothetical protein